ncbi:MAG: hypothetical protein IJF87_12185 [Erysipelotrichaceae bacterium]|nr:hypothetical protein [Erysipelotrichaceae bacterium]MBQ6493346.1 hypothetical protein [Erysipelotrichaceae bacterium]
MALVRFNFLSRCLGRQVDVHAIIPTYTNSRSKEKIEDIYNRDQKFKTVYLLHGFSGDCNDYITFTNIVRYAEDNQIAVIIPSGFNSWYFNYEPGEKNRSFIAEELLQVTRFMFPLSDRREDTYIAGLSMGAAGSAMIALAYPETYSKVYCMSGAPNFIDENTVTSTTGWFGEDENVYHSTKPSIIQKKKDTIEDAYFTAAENICQGKPMPEFFMTIGDKDHLLGSATRFYEYLKELDYDVKMEIVAGYGHEWDFWDLKIREALEKYFSN